MSLGMSNLVTQYSEAHWGLTTKTSYITTDGEAFAVHSITRFHSGNFIKTSPTTYADLESATKAARWEARNI